MGRKYTLNPARPVTFSLTSEHLEVIHDRVENSRLKSRSEWLQNIIQNNRMIGEMTTSQIIAYLIASRVEIFEHISRPVLVKITQELMLE